MCVVCVCVVSVSEQWHIWRPQGASVHIRHLHEVLRTRARISRSFEGPENLGKYTRKDVEGRAAAIGNLTRIAELPFYYMQNHTWHHIIYTLSRFQQILLSYIRVLKENSYNMTLFSLWWKQKRFCNGGTTLCISNFLRAQLKYNKPHFCWYPEQSSSHHWELPVAIYCYN